MKVIFLDIDGVLVNRASLFQRSGGTSTASPGCISALNRIISSTGAEVVISSSWRLDMTMAELRRKLRSWGVRGRLYDKTPFMRSTPRSGEIQAWIEAQQQRKGPIESFVILDDETSMDGLAAQLVTTLFDDGLTEQDADHAIAILAKASPGY